MFDRYESGEQAILVHINFTYKGELEDLDECKMLVSSAEINTLAVVKGTRQSPLPKYYVGEGKALEIAEPGSELKSQLFATLDPTLRKIEVADVGTSILVDTVGFIHHLPHDLVAAFKGNTARNARS